MSQRGQAWHLWVGLIISLAGAAGIWWFGHWLPFSQQMLLWVLLLIGLAVVTRRFWTEFLGPLFLYDVIRTGRRNPIPARCIYACILLAAVCMLFSNWFPMRWGLWESLFSPGSLQVERLTRFAESFFATFLAAQVTVVFLLTPIYVAGSIAQEKERRTLDYLLTTDLGDREIIFGILGSRMANLSLLLLTGLPILMLIQFLGGVDAGLILAGFAVTGMTMISLGSLSMAVSVSAKSSTAAIFITYGLSAFLFACFACLPGIGNPVRVFLFGLADDPPVTSEVISIVAITVVIHAFITTVCLVFATNQLRPVAQYVASFPSRSLPRPAGGDRTAKRVPVSGRISQEGWGPEELARPLDPDMLPPVSSTPWPHRRRPVTDPPMLWKEFYRERGASPLLVVYFGVVVAGLFLSLLGFGDLESRRNWAHHVGPVFTCLVLFVVPFGVAGSITRERERQTLDTLLVTPLERREILYGKWLGSILAVRWPLGFLAGAYGLAALAGGMHWTAWPLLVVCLCRLSGQPRVVPIIGMLIHPSCYPLNGAGHLGPGFYSGERSGLFVRGWSFPHPNPTLWAVPASSHDDAGFQWQGPERRLGRNPGGSDRGLDLRGGSDRAVGILPGPTQPK